MVEIKIDLSPRFKKRLESMAKDYDFTVSEVVAEMVEWTLDSEKDFRKDLESELPDEEKKEEE